MRCRPPRILAHAFALVVAMSAAAGNEANAAEANAAEANAAEANAAEAKAADALGGADAANRPIDTLPRHAETHFNFVVVGVSDMARSLAFYTQVLGLHERGRAQPDLQHYEVIVGFDDRPLSPGISLKFRNGPPQPRGNGSSALNFVLTGLAERVAKVAALGGKVTLAYARHASPTLDYGYATIEDPDGNAIELVEYFSMRKAAP